MSYTKRLYVDFIYADYDNLATVGYALYADADTLKAARATTGVKCIRAGHRYYVDATLDDGWEGYVEWDTGTASPEYAYERINDEAADIGAAVDASTAGMKIASISAAGVTFQSAVSQSGQVLTITQGDDYLSADGRALVWTSDDWPATIASVVLRLRAKETLDEAIEISGTVVSATTMSVDLAAADTAALVPGRGVYTFALVATLSDASIVTLVDGAVRLECP